jgi:hypothetical protein
MIARTVWRDGSICVLAITLPQLNLPATQTDHFVVVREDDGPTFVAARRCQDFES